MQARQASAAMPNLEEEAQEEAPKRKVARRKQSRPTRKASSGSTTSSKAAPKTFPGAVAVAGINSSASDDEKADDSKQSWTRLTERARGRVGAVASHGSDDVSKEKEKEDRDRIQLGASRANDDGVARLPSAASSKTDSASFCKYASAKDLDLGKQDSELHTFGTPIVAELALNEEDVEAKVSSRLQVEIEERLRREVTERLERERDMQIVAEAVEVRGVRFDEYDDEEEEDICGLSRSRFFVVVAIILIVALVVIILGVVLGTRADTELSTASPANFTTGSPTVAPTRYTTSDFDGLLNWIGPLVTDNIQTLQDPTTPQYVAFDWLANVDGYKASDDFFITPEQVFIERYVLALLYFSTNGNSWKNQYNFTLPRSICDWNDEGGDGVRGVLCNEKLYVEQLLIRKFLVVTFNSLDRRWGRNLTVHCVLFLFAAESDIQGNIPSEIALLTSLANLNLDKNFIFGPIPMEIFKMSNLVSFSAEDCALTGTIPTEVGQMTSLESIIWNDNALRGSIPTEVGLWTKLTLLELRINKFDGSVPTEIGRLTNLKEIDFQGNALTGTIPTEIGSLTLMNGLYFEENFMGGLLPSEIGLLTNLADLSFFDNQFKGTVPPEYSKLQQLEVIYLENNDLTGSVDDIFCVSRPPFLQDMWANCRGNPPELQCSCCTTCCDLNGENCD
jgi:hypothetical protein